MGGVVSVGPGGIAQVAAGIWTGGIWGAGLGFLGENLYNSVTNTNAGTGSNLTNPVMATSTAINATK
jgi:hypothetical protein